MYLSPPSTTTGRTVHRYAGFVAKQQASCSGSCDLCKREELEARQASGAARETSNSPKDRSPPSEPPSKAFAQACVRAFCVQASASASLHRSLRVPVHGLCPPTTFAVSCLLRLIHVRRPACDQPDDQ